MSHSSLQGSTRTMNMSPHTALCAACLGLPNGDKSTSSYMVFAVVPIQGTPICCIRLFFYDPTSPSPSRVSSHLRIGISMRTEGCSIREVLLILPPSADGGNSSLMEGLSQSIDNSARPIKASPRKKRVKRFSPPPLLVNGIRVQEDGGLVKRRTRSPLPSAHRSERKADR